MFNLLPLLLVTGGLGAAAVRSDSLHDSTTASESDCQFTYGDRAFNMCTAFAISGDWMKTHGYDMPYSNFGISTDKHGHNGEPSIASCSINIVIDGSAHISVRTEFL